MRRPSRARDAVSVVGGDAETRDRLVSALDAEFAATATADADALLEGVRAGAVGCVVCVDDAIVYDDVRDEVASVPVVVVTDGVDDDLVSRVMDDDFAEYVRLDETVETLLPARTRRLRDRNRSRTSWELADFAGDAVVEFDLESHGLLEANERFFERWRWDRDALADATLSDLFVTDITHELRGRGRGQAGEEQLEWMTEGDPVETLVENGITGNAESREWHCRDESGRRFKADVHLVADRDHGRGFLVASVPAIADEGASSASASASSAASAPANTDADAMLQSVMEHVPMSVYFEDTRGRQIRVSEDLVEPFIESPEGKILHTPEDVHGKTHFDLYPAETAEEALADNERVVDSGTPIRNREEHVQPPQGRELFFSTTKAPWYDSEGRIQGVVGVTVDITEHKRRERELDRQNERLEEFASIVSHDLRNPLNVAQGRLQLYRQNGEASELETVAEMHDRMAEIIDEVLAFAREGSRIEEPEWVSGSEQAGQAWDGVDTAQATLEQEWDYSVQADPSRLVRLFENLFRNAVEHAGTDIVVDVGTLDDEPGFYVQDNGPGIPPDEREAIFERGTSSADDGTGYGLAIVREIAEAHGWDVAVTDGTLEGAEDGFPGARFEFTGVPRGE